MSSPQPLAGYRVIIQHKPETAAQLRPLFVVLGATVVLTERANATIVELERSGARFVILDSHDADGDLNDSVALRAFQISVGICYSRPLPKHGLLTLVDWIDIAKPASAVIDRAPIYRRTRYRSPIEGLRDGPPFRSHS
ncbi:hypothetical protein [Rhizobium leguminosarum]|uniref:hypothetical protein n=1 Tax=Rhizobium leguminosarum TaxID=384 RepID=UPI00103A9C0F|nr:hypothetical protein [Rhizobium leguminosarum]MBY5328426.1 hypothetical protein [Rhizobium leguminosarum]TBZ72372.1 hypothetical protein E0H43_16615 [Rhizobium leguminosarum bv. viciae]